MNLFLTDQPGGNIGSASTTYVSIADPTATSTAGDQCQGLGLPTLPSGWTYHCVASSSVRNVDGTGWVPISFKSISVGSPFNSLPQDPISQTSTGLYYTYVTNGTQYEVNGVLESQKYKTQVATSPQAPDYPEVLAEGNNLTLSPLWSTSGLVAYWPLNEGTGTTAYDQSGNGSTASLAAPLWILGKVGPWAPQLAYASSSGVTYNIASPSKLPSTAVTVSTWVNVASHTNWPNYVTDSWCVPGGWLLYSNSAGTAIFGVMSGTGVSCSTQNNAQSATPFSTGTWHLLTGTYDGATVKIYVDGSLTGSTLLGGQTLQQTSSLQTADATTTISMNDIRIYNRALSAAEIAALYNAEH